MYLVKIEDVPHLDVLHQANTVTEKNIKNRQCLKDMKQKDKNISGNKKG